MDQGQLDALYQQYLGRGVDPSGAASWGGADYDTVINGILGSQEYAQRQASNGVSAPAGANPQDLANQVFSAYKTNNNYDQTLNQLNATPQDAAYYRARIGLIGQMMGWQSGQNTGDRNSVYQKELESYLPGARAAGLSDTEINNLISQNSAATNQENQQRIAQDASKGNGWVNQNIPGGYTTLAALAAAVAAPYLAPELLASEAVPLADITGSTFGGSAFALPETIGATEAATGASTGFGLNAGSGYSGYGLNPALQTGGEFAYGGTGLNPAITGYEGIGLNPVVPGVTEGLATNAGALAAASGIPIDAATFGGYGALTAAQEAALNSALTSAAAGAGGSTLGNVLKGAALATALKAAGGSSKTGTSGTSGFNPYSTAASGLNSQLPGYIHGNDNPFVFSKEQPIQDTRQASYNPFDALNVKEPIPGLPQNPYAKSLLG